jgi:hypothetical protein
MMKKTSQLMLLVTVMVLLLTTVPVRADKSWQISSPRGGKINLVIRDTAIQNFKISDFDFSDNGKKFSVTAEAVRQSTLSQTLEIEFLDGNMLVQKEYVIIGRERTQTSLTCPEKFDRIVIQ